MKLYFINSRTLNAEYLIAAENEWQARDIADSLDYGQRLWEAEMYNRPEPKRIPYFTLGNGTAHELRVETLAPGNVATIFDVNPLDWVTP